MSDKRLVHILDDEESIRRSLDFVLRHEGYETATWSDPADFFKCATDHDRACMLLDVRMPGMDGLDVQKKMSDEGLNLPVIVLTGHGDVPMAVRALQAGAIDFLEKPVDREHLLGSIARAFEYNSDCEAQRSRREWAAVQVNALTEREREVLNGLACGYPNKTIAYDLGISARTVEVYRANVMTKLQVANFADALRIAFAAGMGSDREWREEHLGPQTVAQNRT